MNGAHDLGGMHGFGPVPRALDAPFRSDWQRRVFALTEALAPVAGYTADRHRAAIERIPPARYLRHDYFARWLEATERLVVEAGLVRAEELRPESADRADERHDSRVAPPIAPRSDRRTDSRPGTRPDTRPDTQAGTRRESRSGSRAIGALALVEAARAGAASRVVDTDRAARFGIGERVRVRLDAPPWHTRAPGYVRGRIGTVVHEAGVFPLADSVARGAGTDPQHVYTIAFTASALWGRDAESPDDLVHVDLWESYLEPD